MTGRASIVGAAATHVGKVREHNEDAHFFDADKGIFVVCDGMGGHAAGEVASELAIQKVRSSWSSQETQNLADQWNDRGTPEARHELLQRVRAGAIDAHEAIVAAGNADQAKAGMGTTLVGALVVGSEMVFAQAGDSRAYIVREGIAMQLTEDHTLLARLMAAGIEVDVTGEGARFRSMLTNALGIGQECKVTTFIVPLADGDRFLLCSDGISEYVPEAEVGIVLTTSPSPARAAQKLIDLALERGGGDNATAVVVRVLEAGETPQPSALLKRDDEVIASSPLWGRRLSPQQRLRALRIAMQRDFAATETLPPHTLGDRVTWIILEGELDLDGLTVCAGACVYPESVAGVGQVPDRDGQAIATTAVRALAFRADDWREICAEDSELGEVLQEALTQLLEANGVIIPGSAADQARIERNTRARSDTFSPLAEPPPPVGPPMVSFGAPAPPVGGDAPTLKSRRLPPLAGVGGAPTPPVGFPAVPQAIFEAPTRRLDPVPRPPPVPLPRLAPKTPRVTPPIGIPTRIATPAFGIPTSPPAAPKAPDPVAGAPQATVTIPPARAPSQPSAEIAEASAPPAAPAGAATLPPRAKRISEGWDD